MQTWIISTDCPKLNQTASLEDAIQACHKMIIQKIILVYGSQFSNLLR